MIFFIVHAAFIRIITVNEFSMIRKNGLKVNIIKIESLYFNVFCEFILKFLFCIFFFKLMDVSNKTVYIK